MFEDGQILKSKEGEGDIWLFNVSLTKLFLVDRSVRLLYTTHKETKEAVVIPIGRYDEPFILPKEMEEFLEVATEV